MKTAPNHEDVRVPKRAPNFWIQLAPDIQERVLNLESIDGRDPLSERALRQLVRDACWAGQRVAFAVLLPQG